MLQDFADTSADTRFDAVDHRLSRAGISLRRTLGDGGGWSLDLPAGPGGERIGLRRPLESNPSAVPAAFLVLLRARLRGRPVQPLEDGSVGDGQVEDGSVETRSVETRSVGVGAGSDPVAPVGKSDDLSRVRTADVVRTQFSDLVTALLELDPLVRLKRAGAAEQALSLTGRLAGGLIDFAPLLPTGPVSPALGFDLAWLTQVLGAARDAQLLSERLPTELDRQPLEAIGGPIRRRIGRDLEQQQRRAQITLIQALNSPRYLALLDALDELAAPRPAPAPAPAPDDVQTELTQLVARSHRRLLTALDRFTRTGELDPLLVAVGRSRAAAETVAVVVGRPARRYARRAAKLQVLLQDHRDILALRAGLITLATRSSRPTRSGFGYGRLHAGLERRAELDTAEFADRCRALTDRASSWSAVEQHRS